MAGSIHKQGYVSGVGSFLSFPSIGVTDDGLGVIAFTLMGPNYFPSAAQISINPSGTTGSIWIVRDGFRPEDGFSCFAEFGSGPQCRWGDYSASVGTPDGAVALLAVQDATAEDERRDPAIGAARRQLRSMPPLRPGERVTHVRFWFSDDV